MTTRILKKSCTTAADRAPRNSVSRLICDKETSELVTEVPILAPIMMGIAFVTFNAPPATNPTTIEVVDEEDWTMEVERIPMNRPTNGLVVVAISVSAKSLPNILREVPMSSRLKRKRYKKHRRKMRLNRVMYR